MNKSIQEIEEKIIYTLNKESEGYRYIKDLLDKCEPIDVSDMSREEIKRRFFKSNR
jgi:hypothetical protein